MRASETGSQGARLVTFALLALDEDLGVPPGSAEVARIHANPDQPQTPLECRSIVRCEDNRSLVERDGGRGVLPQCGPLASGCEALRSPQGELIGVASKP
jgi:hypothetical protein